MLRRVLGEEEPTPEHVAVVVDVDAAGGREPLPIATYRYDVVVAGHRPEATLFVVVDGSLIAKPLVGRIGIAVNGR